MGADLVRMKAKKQREKEVKEKHDKEISAELTEGKSSNSISRMSFANNVGVQLKEKFGGLERRITNDIGNQISKCVSDLGLKAKSAT